MSRRGRSLSQNCPWAIEISLKYEDLQLTLAVLWFPAERGVLRGGGYYHHPLLNSRICGRSEEDKTAIETYQKGLLKDVLRTPLKEHKAGRGQVKVNIITFRDSATETELRTQSMLKRFPRDEEGRIKV